MFLPNRKNAHIPERKLKEYLLSTEHRIGKAKALFFHKYGFTNNNSDLLKVQLIGIAQKGTVQSFQKTVFDTKYVIEGYIKTHGNNKAKIRTIWIVEIEANNPKLLPRIQFKKIMIKELDTVVLLKNIPSHKLEKGDIGAVVHDYGKEAFEVEFVTSDGNTLGIFTLKTTDIKKMEGNEILHARPLA